MKPTICALSLLAALGIGGVLVVKELKQITLAAGGPNAVLPAATTDTSLQQENQQLLKQVVEDAMKKVQPVIDVK